MKLSVFFLFLFFFQQITAQNINCENAVEFNDSVLISDCAIKELWFRFRAEDRKFILNIVSADSLAPVDYILYKDAPGFCEKVKTDSLIPVGVSFHHGPHEYEGLTLEEIAGLCCCSNCEARERFMSLKKDSLYYLKVFPRGKAVLIKKDYNYSKGKKKDPFSEPLVVGKAITVENIYFYPESPDFLPASMSGLEKLYKFLESNSSIHVEIQGHVNSPGNKNDPKDKRLSQDRANAVMRNLVKRGISAERLKAKGYGNSKMIFPVPKNDYEMMQNRRVEIVVTKL